MANYTAADVKRLRELTGSGMMDCKKALEESEGDLEKAVELLRIKGAKDVGKRAERATSNGLVVAEGGTMVELNCETDFVAKSDDFVDLATKILGVAVDQGPAGRGHGRGRHPGAERPDRREARAQALHPRRRAGRGLPAPPFQRPAAGHRRARRVRGLGRGGGPQRRDAHRRRAPAVHHA
jgi:hypothetical protein